MQPRVQKRSASTFEERPLHENIYTAEYNKARKAEAEKRRKRATADNKRTCTLFLQSDTMLWTYMTNSEKERGLEYVSNPVDSVVVMLKELKFCFV